MLIMENVPQVVGKRNINDFRQWVEFLNHLGYTSAYQMLNAKDYGIPQNRQRCFMVSILGDNFYDFPEKQKLTLKLKDMLENNVDIKYYLSDKMLQFICKDREFTKGKRKTINRDIACTKTTREANTSPDTSDYISDKLPQNFDLNLLIKENTSNGFKEATIGDGVYISGVDKKRGTVQKQTIQTLKTTPSDIGVVVPKPNYMKNLGIRKLTPLECWRLMGFNDNDFIKAKNSLNNTFYKGLDKSNSQLYKQAGNSIVVNVLEAIFKQML